LGLTLIAGGLLVLEFLVLAAVQGWFEAPQVDTPAWLQDTAVGEVLATATPTPLPTPTMAPDEIAAQFFPQLEDALAGDQWDRGLELVAIMQAVDPTGGRVNEWALTTHMQYGQALVEESRVPQALVQFDEAVALVPGDEEARLWQETSQQYLVGRQALRVGMWDAAIQAFTEAYGQIPEYTDVFARLMESYRRKGQAAIEGEDWPTAVEALIQVFERSPDDADWAAEVADLLLAAYRGKGRAEMADEDWDSAIQTLTEGSRRLSEVSSHEAQLTELLSEAYQGKGRAQMANEDWGGAIETLTKAQKRLPEDTSSATALVGLLASAYRGRGIAFEENLKLKQAKADLQTALALRPGDATARKHLDRVKYLLSKRIVIDISEQRLYAYHGDKLVYKFKVSTGLKGRATKTGHFQVLDKIPEAYSRIWKLRMPYWMGIYWVKGIENGIHALPIRPDGTVMWGGLLGTRQSYGCVILSTSAAKQLYKWADIGTQVDIRR
jgi:tetratricopeptide (TPR) repeat protein